MEHGNPRNVKTGKKSLSPILLWAVFASLPSSWTNDSRLQQQWIAMCLSWNREREVGNMSENVHYSRTRIDLPHGRCCAHTNWTTRIWALMLSYIGSRTSEKTTNLISLQPDDDVDQQLIRIKQFFNLQSGLFVRALDCERDQKNMLKTSTVRRELCAEVVKSALALA